jgi:putative DNA primase/helicase
MREHQEAFRDALQADLGPLARLPDVIEAGRLHRFSTNGKRGDLSGWCRLFEDGRAGVFGCWRLGMSAVWTAVPRDRLTPAEGADLRRRIAEDKAQRESEQRAAWRKNLDRIAYLRRQCVPVTEGDPVHLYLCSRLAIESFAVPECILLHQAMPYVHEGETVGTFPAMVAPLITRAGDVLALHRTYLTTAGKKAPVPGPVKKLTPAAGLLRGSHIPLHQPVDGAIGIGEGIETSLAACLASGVPTVAAYSAGNLAAWQWPGSVRRLVIFADHDKAGVEAADALRTRALAAGVRVQVLTPETPGHDWADAWSMREAACA